MADTRTREKLGRVIYEAMHKHMGERWPKARGATWDGVPEVSKEYYRVAADAVLETVLHEFAVCEATGLKAPDVNSPEYLAAQAELARRVREGGE